MNDKRLLSRRTHSLSILLGALLLLLIGTGCATISIITEVMNDAEGDHADVTVRIDIDEGVARAADFDTDALTTIPEGLRAGWTYQGNVAQTSMTFRRHFANLGDLAQLPNELRTLSNDYSIDLLQDMTVTVMPTGLGQGHDYFFESTIVIPQPESEDSAAAPACNPNTQTLGEYIGCAVDYNIDGDPELKAALEAAGAPVVSITTVLPGMITRMRINEDEEGTRIDEGQVVWELDGIRAGTYELYAVSTSLLGANAQEDLLNQALSGDMGFQGLMESMGLDSQAKSPASDRAKALANNLQTRLPADLPRDALVQIVSPFLRANVLANLSDVQGKPLFPIFRAVAPIITRMALNGGTDPDARIALGRLVELLITLETERLEAESEE